MSPNRKQSIVSRAPHVALIEMMEQRTLMSAAPISLDQTFGTGGAVTDIQPIAGESMLTAPDPTTGDVYVIGNSAQYSNSPYNVQKFTASGTVITTFGDDGLLTAPMAVGAIGAQAQSDGKLLVLAELSDIQTYILTRYTTTGALDTTFGTAGTATFTDTTSPFDNDSLGSFAVLGNGDIVIPEAATVGNTTFSASTELTSTGSLNTAFGINGVATGIAGSFDSVAADASGNLVAVGVTAATAASPAFATSAAMVTRFTSVGQLDPTFGTNGTTVAPNSGYFFSVHVTSTGIAASGVIFYAPPVSSIAPVLQLNHFTPIGHPDTSFGSGTGSLSLGVNGRYSQFQPDGKLLITGIYGGFSISRWNVDGSPDSTFGSDGFDDLSSLNVFDTGVPGSDGLSVDSNGRILLSIAPQFAAGSGLDFSPGRLLTNGSPDVTFGPNGVAVGRPLFSSADAIAELPNGQTLVAGVVTLSTVSGLYIQRFNTNGSVDSTFAPGQGYAGQNGYVFVGPLANVQTGYIATAEQIAVDDAGNIYLGEANAGILRFSASGYLDTSFGTDGMYANPDQAGFLVEPNGQILEGSGTSLTRLNANGTVDTTFGTAGTATPPAAFSASWNLLTTQPDGKILVGGASYSAAANSGGLAALRLNTNGSVDSSFGKAGIAFADQLPEQQLQNSDVSYDVSAGGIALLPNGNIVVSGSGGIEGHASFHIGPTVAEFLATGKLNPAFGEGGQTPAYVPDSQPQSNTVGLVVQSDGTLVVAGTQTFGVPPSSNSYIFVVRYNPDGSIDDVFTNQIIPDNQSGVGATDNSEDVTAGPNGTVIVSANLFPVNDLQSFGGLARYIVNGASNQHLLTGTVIGSIGSYGGKGNVAANAFDGLIGTFFDAKQASGDWAGLDLGSAKVITQISFAPRFNWSYRMLGGVFQGSNTPNFSSGVQTLYTITDTPLEGVLTSVSLTGTAAFRYVRYLGPNGSYCNIAEAEFFSSPEKLAGTVIGTAGSYNNQGNTIANVFDGNLSTFFDAPTASGAWVGLDLGTPQIVAQVSFAPRDSNWSGFAKRMIGGEIQASNTADFSSGVVTVYTITTAPPVEQLTTVTLPVVGAYQYWRYIGPDGGSCNIAELAFIG